MSMTFFSQRRAREAAKENARKADDVDKKPAAPKSPAKSKKPAAPADKG